MWCLFSRGFFWLSLCNFCRCDVHYHYRCGYSFTDYSVKILSPALIAEQGGRGDLVKLFLAPILALMVGIGLAFYMENLDHSISNREDVERHVNIPVLASFPETRVGEFGSRTSGSFGPASIPFRRRGSGRL